IDPGNFGTNISGGSQYNYSLVWVVLWSNLIAIFMQMLSAKLGIATEKNLPQMCGIAFPRSVNWFFWVIAELAAIATDLAEFLGCTLGLYLLFNIPMLYAGLISGALTFLIVFLSKYGQRIVELVITILVLVICASFGIELFLSKPDWVQAGLHTLIPSLPGAGALFIAIGMLGATVMPHVIYLHSQLVQSRNHSPTYEKKKRHLKMERIDIIIAMNIAFIVNAAMVIVSASVFFGNGIVVDTIEKAPQVLSPLLGNISAVAFGIALLASGLSSSAVGTMAGQTILQGFVGLKISDNVTRLVTMIPGILLIIIGINPMQALVLSQVTLSFVLPAAIIPMLLITSKKKYMGPFANKPLTTVAGWIICSIIIAMNTVLVALICSGNL
ncbi:MAG: Nramp family divalent metal transporter, partial [Eubacteriales bacterium]